MNTGRSLQRHNALSVPWSPMGFALITM